jgi:rod shape-determining protein MreD
MNAAKLAMAFVICIWVAGSCQQGIAGRETMLIGRPDFLLVTIVCCSLFARRACGGLIGFVGGIVQGALAGANLAGYVVSRTICGFCVGWLRVLEPDYSATVAFLTAIGATLLSQLLLMFIAPPSAIGSFVLATIISAVYNGVIAVPVFELLKKILDPPNR